MTHIYSSIAFAIHEHSEFLMDEDKSFEALIKKIKALRIFPKVEQEVEHINFFIKKSARRKFKSTHNYKVVKTLAAELDLLCSWIKPDSGVHWEAPISHIIKRVTPRRSLSDSCFYGGGCFSLDLIFW